MANKKVTSPCVASGTLATEDTSKHWYDKRSNSTKSPCPECLQLITISSKNRKFRLHNTNDELISEREVHNG